MRAKFMVRELQDASAERESRPMVSGVRLETFTAVEWQFAVPNLL
jgi:hypothetical protein